MAYPYNFNLNVNGFDVIVDLSCMIDAEYDSSFGLSIDRVYIEQGGKLLDATKSDNSALLRILAGLIANDAENDAGFRQMVIEDNGYTWSSRGGNDPDAGWK